MKQAVESVLHARRLHHVAFSHFEADVCGALNEWLTAARCGHVPAMVSVDDVADRPPCALADGEVVRLGKRSVKRLDAPHLPHAWECGFLMELSTRTLFCGDLLTQPGDGLVPLTEGDVLGPSEAFRAQMNYF